VASALIHSAWEISKLGAPARRNRYLRKIPATAKARSAASLRSVCFRLNFRGFPVAPYKKTRGPRSGPLNWDEDRCTLRTGHGPENITRLRRFATGLIKSKSRDSVAATIAKLARNVRRVFDYLRMTRNSVPRLPLPCDEAS
jgi:hypothetical protein